MNEKEDRALAAFEAGRKALEAGQGGQNIAGEMLTVSLQPSEYALMSRTWQSLMSMNQKILQPSRHCINSSRPRILHTQVPHLHVHK